MNDLISIIVPIYKVEKYLRDCLDSIINQTYKNLEIILVDDGSPDNCPQICDEYAEKDNRIVVIHQKNAGCAAARNSGLDIAKGKYISYIDSDDTLHVEFIEVLYKLIIEHNADVAVCDYVRIFDYNQKIEEKPEEIKEYTNIEFAHFYNERLLGIGDIVWNKLYKKELIQDIRFDEGMLQEDAGYTYKVTDKAKKIVVISRILYYYNFTNVDSCMHSVLDVKRLRIYEFLKERLELFKKRDKALYEEAVLYVLFRIRQDYYYATLSKQKSPEDAVKFLEDRADEYYNIYKKEKIKTGFKENLLIHIFSKFRGPLIALKKLQIAIKG